MEARQVAKHWMQGVVASVLLVMSALVEASWDEAKAVVERTTEQMVSLLADEALREEAAFPQLYSGVESVLDEVVDFDRIARGVMAKYYRRATPEQRERFSSAFRESLIRTYAKALSTFRVGRFETLDNSKPSRKKGQEKVDVNVFSGEGTRYSVTYYLSGKDGDWKLTNVVLDGINLGVTFRNQFANMVEENGGDLDLVIASWSAHMDNEGREA